MIITGDRGRQPAARPLREVLAEHVDQVQAQRAALLELRDHALPADAPGAWIRNAIDAKLADPSFTQ